MMDLSSEYVEMCKQAQKELRPEYEAREQIGDFIYYIAISAPIVLSHGSTQYHETAGFWLPRQDQLQAIVGKNKDIIGMFAREKGDASPMVLMNNMSSYAHHKGKLLFAENLDETTGLITWMPRTMEQWWLMFVMEKIHHKDWSHKDLCWVAIPEFKPNVPDKH